MCPHAPMLKFCLNPFRLIRVVILIKILITLIRVLLLINPDPGSNPHQTDPGPNPHQS